MYSYFPVSVRVSERRRATQRMCMLKGTMMASCWAAGTYSTVPLFHCVQMFPTLS